MIRIGRRRNEIEALLERLGVVVLGVNGERPDTGDLGGVQRAKHRVFEKPVTEAHPLPGRGNR